MGTYGRNFDFRVPPFGAQRRGRFFLSGANNIPIGVPVKCAPGAVADTQLNTLPVSLATGAQAPVNGLSGVAVYEHAPAAYAGFDPVLTTYSDIDFVPAGKNVQVVSGKGVKVLLKNTTTKVFLGSRTYQGRVMVAGIGIPTPTLQVGDLLTPGTGDDVSGYWAETSTADNAWLVVTHVDNVRAEIEAEFVF